MGPAGTGVPVEVKRAPVSDVSLVSDVRGKRDSLGIRFLADPRQLADLRQPFDEADSNDTELGVHGRLSLIRSFPRKRESRLRSMKNAVAAMLRSILQRGPGFPLARE